MIVTKEQIKSIIELAKVLVDNHEDEVECNNNTVNRIKVIASALDNNENIQITNYVDYICGDACGSMNIEVYSAILNDALDKYVKDEMFKIMVDDECDINIPKAVTLVGCYICYVASNEVLKIIRQ